MSELVTKYFLGTVDKTTINDKIEISNLEYENCLNILEDFNELIENENLFNIVDLNYEELKSKFHFYSLRSREISTSNSSDFNKVFIDINRVLLNLLSAIRTFLDHKETQIKKKFGKDSKEILFFKNETNIAFDNNFEYRFIFKLRNYAQHCGLPTGQPQVKSFLNSNNEIQSEFNVYFERDRLLQKFEWGLIVRKDLESQQERFEFLPVIEKEYELLSSMNKNINDRILENYITESNHLLNMIKKTEGLEGLPYLMKSEGVDTINYTLHEFPLNHISKIKGTKIL